MDQNTHYKLKSLTSLFILYNNNRNEAIKEQSLNFDKNLPKQTIALELIVQQHALQL